MSFLDIFQDSGQTFFDAIEKFIVDSDQYLKDAFESSNIDDSWWAAVVGTPSSDGMLATWMPIIVPILVLLVSIQVIVALVKGSGLSMARAFVGAVLGVPGTYIAVWAVQVGSAVADEATSYLMGGYSDGHAGIFINILGLQVSDRKITGVADGYFMWDGLADKAGGWQLLGALLLAIIIWFLSMILGFVMSLRSMAIVILAAMAGWAVVATSLEVTKSWFSSWSQLVVGLLLAKPFSAALILMSQDIFNYANSSSQFFAGLAGLVLAIAMPFAAVKLVAFTSVGSIGGVDQATGSAATGPVRGGVNVVRSATRRSRRK
ncbi:hypothetical protein [Rothia sp. P4278]|uniref:hypothetical protein n=1 Tax=Rothia sp. P4278 TaxID=3402658 RepID=UPI003AED7C42